jgi:hypothetical protein
VHPFRVKDVKNVVEKKEVKILVTFTNEIHIYLIFRYVHNAAGHLLMQVVAPFNCLSVYVRQAEDR